MQRIWFLSLIFLTHCATTPKVDHARSASYQRALKDAFDDMEQRDHTRSPAAEADVQEFERNFEKTQYFTVVVTPKVMRLGSQHDSAQNRIVNADVEHFQFRIDRQGHCALAGDLVAPADRANCVQVEIKPVDSTIPGAQFVRVFMTPEYRVYGVSYHEFNARTNKVAKARKLVEWDQAEPLSSEMLALAKDVLPLDLPIYASNRLTKSLGEVTLKSPRGGRCQGWNYRYKNAYGSWVTAGWCTSDPWPSVVETNRYLAVLLPVEK